MQSFPSLARTAALGIGAVMITLGGSIASAGVASAEDLETIEIDTYSSWDGVSFVRPWGHPDTATYGQWIRIPAGARTITQFSFFMQGYDGIGKIDYRAAVYTWKRQQQRAGTRIYESDRRTISVDPALEVQEVRIEVEHGKVEAGRRYVLFLSVSKDYESTDPDVRAKWAAHGTDVLAHSALVYQSSGGDESRWTTKRWHGSGQQDFAMKVTLE